MSMYEQPIKHRHEDGREHAHGGSDDRELNRFLRSVGQIKEGERCSNGTYGDDPHSHGWPGETSSGQVVWSERKGDISVATKTR